MAHATGGAATDEDGPITIARVIDVVNGFVEAHPDMPLVSDTGDCLFATVEIRSNECVACQGLPRSGSYEPDTTYHCRIQYAGRRNCPTLLPSSVLASCIILHSEFCITAALAQCRLSALRARVGPKVRNHGDYSRNDDRRTAQVDRAGVPEGV